jgi:hypothetical protein
MVFVPAGVYQVKWNKVTTNLFATTHEGDIRIWDQRVSHFVLSNCLGFLGNREAAHIDFFFLWIE